MAKNKYYKDRYNKFYDDIDVYDYTYSGGIRPDPDPVYSPPEATYRVPGAPVVAYKKVYIDVEGDKTLWELPYVSDATLNSIKKAVKYKETESGTTIFLSKENAKYTKGHKSVQCCAFDATNEYMSSVLGCRLSHDDRNWFVYHPDVTSEGLPMGHTFGIINELVRPYGIGISKIYMRKRSTLSADAREWMEVLGVNPKSVVDRDCSNEEYLDLISANNPNVKEAMRSTIDDFRFEFVDKIPMGSYIIFRSWNDTGVSPGGGHAMYVGPRGDYSGFIVAIQLDRNPKYHKTPSSKDYSDVEYLELDFWNSLSNEGKKFNEYNNVVSYRNYKYSPPGKLMP
jgi:hypothetical protein